MEREDGCTGWQGCQMAMSEPVGVDAHGSAEAIATAIVRVVPGDGEDPGAQTIAAELGTSDAFNNVCERRNDLDVKTP